MSDPDKRKLTIGALARQVPELNIRTDRGADERLYLHKPNEGSWFLTLVRAARTAREEIFFRGDGRLVIGLTPDKARSLENTPAPEPDCDSALGEALTRVAEQVASIRDSATSIIELDPILGKLLSSVKASF